MGRPAGECQSSMSQQYHLDCNHQVSSQYYMGPRRSLILEMLVTEYFHSGIAWAWGTWACTVVQFMLVSIYGRQLRTVTSFLHLTFSPSSYCIFVLALPHTFTFVLSYFRLQVFLTLALAFSYSYFRIFVLSTVCPWVIVISRRNVSRTGAKWR